MLLHVVLVHLDEHHFNKKRQHSKYEIASVISDGVLFLLPQLLAVFVTYHEKWELLYKVLGAISMISIVKNELFYKNLEVRERLTHACLYVLHPIILFSFYESWQNNYFSTHTYFWMFQLIYVGIGFKTITYQLIYWNYIHEK
jgi:hypothetical protein